MPTADGISSEDWDAIHEMSLKIVNAEAEAERNIHTKHLLQFLDELDDKYGVLPSILATRADYVADDDEKASYLRQAYALAEAIDDKIDMREIAHSLAELYIEDLKQITEGRDWLERLRNQLKHSTEESLKNELERLQALLDRQTPPSN